MLAPAAYGFSICLGLIVAIGAQNAFVLTQGIRRNHPLLIAMVCILCDALLIGIGVAGLGTLFAKSETLTHIATWGGAVFLVWYGFGSLRSAFKGGNLIADDAAASSLKTVVFATLAVTFLNPHAYLDTIVLMGSLSARFIGMERFWFWIGAITASSVWFFSLTLGGRILAPWFRKPISWRILDGTICLVMWTIAFSLVRHSFPA